MSGSRDHGRQHVPVPVQQTEHAIESKLSNRDTTVNQTNGKRAVSQKDRWARAAFEIGALLYYLSRR